MEVRHVYLEQNRVADELAKHALTHQMGLIMIDDVPSGLKDKLREDQLGARFQQRIPANGKKGIIQEAEELEFYVARRLGATTWSLPGPMTAQIDEARRRSCVQREPFAVNSIQDLKRCENLEKELRSLKLNLAFMNRLQRLVAEPNEGNAWHADHIIPVYKGADVTAAQHNERRKERLKAKKHLRNIMRDLKIVVTLVEAFGAGKWQLCNVWTS
nr:DNA annealing helicase and endonuclease ZRANB3 isoform X1 [Ipomoea batatas]